MNDTDRRDQALGGSARALAQAYRSSVGRKYVMALSGLAIVGFVVAHLYGTLKIFLGPEETNAYGEALRDLGGHLIPRTHVSWALRIGLIVAFAVHLHAAFSLHRRNRAASGNGLWSMLQSLGARSAALREESLRAAAWVVATAIGVGYASIPVAVQLGIVT